MGKNKVQLEDTHKADGCIYKMPKAAVEALVDPKHGVTRGIAYSQEYLRNYVNNEAGLLRNCVKVDIV